MDLEAKSTLRREFGRQGQAHVEEEIRTSRAKGLYGGSLDLEAKCILRRESRPQKQTVFQGESLHLGNTGKDPFQRGGQDLEGTRTSRGGSHDIESKCEANAVRKGVSFLEGISEI